MTAIKVLLNEGRERMEATTYQEVKEIRARHMKEYVHDYAKLNEFHDKIMTHVIKIALTNIMEKNGPAPASFLFFVMGSAGRSEQSIWSDQDHGIIYEETNPVAKDYFLALGKEISDGLFQTGYEYCRGAVMASNPSWCRSQVEWREQIAGWINESSWESIRNLLILTDSRAIYGEANYLDQLKRFLLQAVKKANLYPKIFDNTMFYQKGVGILGQFLVEAYGAHAGALNLKEKVLFPFVNAIRFLALKENIMDAPTLIRLDKLSAELLPDKERYKQQFSKLLNYRLLYGKHADYETCHFLLIERLTKAQKKELKEIIKTAISLYHFARRNAEKDGKLGVE